MFGQSQNVQKEFFINLFVMIQNALCWIHMSDIFHAKIKINSSKLFFAWLISIRLTDGFTQKIVKKLWQTIFQWRCILKELTLFQDGILCLDGSSISYLTDLLLHVYFCHLFIISSIIAVTAFYSIMIRLIIAALEICNRINRRRPDNDKKKQHKQRVVVHNMHLIDKGTKGDKKCLPSNVL